MPEPRYAPQTYGDLVPLNTCRVVAGSVEPDVLADVVDDYLDLLETSAAIYEANGDYALGIFSSGWCRAMDDASRALAGTADNGEALAGGQPHRRCAVPARAGPGGDGAAAGGPGDHRAAGPRRAGTGGAGRDVAWTIADGLQATGDPRMVRMLLHNLLGNAWKFTSRRPRARIEVDRQGDAFFVRDNGEGFDPAYMHKLFRPFQRLHPVRDFPGNGIGLSVVHRVVARHGGRTWAESSPGAGLTFYFTLPDGGTPHDR